MTHSTQNRSGFTLTELLVVITVITMLAAISLGGLAVVRKQSNVDRTRRTVQKIHFLLMEKLEEYQTKRVKVDGVDNDPRVAAAARTVAMHDLMRMEMPDRKSDVIDSPFQIPLYEIDASGTWQLNGQTSQISRPAASKSFQRRMESALGQPLPSANPTTGEPYENLSAELLYMIIMGMPNASEQFAEFEIGDSNGNGLREFVDAWGEPIRFLRWAPGLDAANSDIQKKDPTDDPSPFDPNGYFKFINGTDGYVLYPIIFSAGPDKKHGVNVESGYIFQGNPYRHSTGPNAGDPNNAGEVMSGEEDDYPDNITNHALDFGKAY